jgi:hypothetical protein
MPMNIYTQPRELTELEEDSFRNKAVLAGFGPGVETQPAIWQGIPAPSRALRTLCGSLQYFTESPILRAQ